MVSKLALFPLKSIVFPGQKLPLHISEPQFSQLIEDCEHQGLTFGIPVFIDNHLSFGTEVELKSLEKTYPSGAKDIICYGLRVFQIRNFLPQEEDYTTGDVSFLQNIEDGDLVQQQQLATMISELYQHLEVPTPQIKIEELHSFTYAHKIGLSLLQEYTLLQLISEKERLDFLINHLCITIPIIQEMNRTKEVLELNGHFQNFDPLDFKEFKIGT